MNKRPYKVPITPVMRKIAYDGNKSFIGFLNDHSCNHHGWIVIAIFYSALHLVEKGLRDINKSADGHIQRNELVIKQELLGKEVSESYLALFNASMTARYDCLPITRQRAIDAASYLNKIEKHLSII